MSARAFYESVVASDYVAKYLNRDLASARPFSDQERIQVILHLLSFLVQLFIVKFIHAFRCIGKKCTYGKSFLVFNMLRFALLFVHVYIFVYQSALSVLP